MALDDRQHVEAVAIMRRLMGTGLDEEAWIAADVWLRENHPEPSVYANAMLEASRTGGSDG